MKTLSVVTTDMFERINNDVNGNPVYVTHYSNIASNYETALFIAKKVGGEKYHNQNYGGGVKFQSYSIQDDVDALNNAIILVVLGAYGAYLVEVFDIEDYDLERFGLSESSHVVDKIKAIVSAESVESETLEGYMRGMPSCFGNVFSDYGICSWGKSNGLLRKNASDISCERFADSYWKELGKALQTIINLQVV